MSNHATVVVTTATRLQHTHTTYIYCTTPKYRLSQIIPVTSWIDSTHIWMMSTVSVATILTMCSGMLVLSAHGTSVTISNAHPRVNVTGDIMDAHDGSYNQWTSGGEWYYYAMGYGTCKQGGDMCHGCGYGYSWIGVWKSNDMSNGSWTLVRDARDDSWPKVTYFRVHVVYNPRTHLYVLWVNLNGGGGGDYAVGTSATPEGPFAFVHAVRAGRPSGGDFDILVDDDGAAYLIYTETRGHTMAAERLTDDFLASAAASPPPITPPPSPPSPPSPPPSGFSLVGDGACRDASGAEPGFATNEPHHVAGFTEEQCAAACRATVGCADFSYCLTNTGCDGACHLYTAATSSGPPGSGGNWSWKPSAGELPVTRVTAEVWWRCYASRAPTTMATPTQAVASATAPSNTSSGVFGNTFVEAPVLFKRKGTYYALFDNCCCFCGHGSGIGVYTAAHPLGPYTYHNNVGCTTNTSLSPGCGCGMDHSIAGGTCDFYGDSLTTAQQNFVIRIPQADGTIQYVWTGDRWQSAVDGIKAHDLQYWSVLEWVSSPGSVDLPRQFVWQDSIQINLT